MLVRKQGWGAEVHHIPHTWVNTGFNRVCVCGGGGFTT